MFQRNKVRNRKPNLCSSVRLSSIGSRGGGGGGGCQALLEGEVGGGHDERARKEPLQGQRGKIHVPSRRAKAGNGWEGSQGAAGVGGGRVSGRAGPTGVQIKDT